MSWEEDRGEMTGPARGCRTTLEIQEIKLFMLVSRSLNRCI